MTAHDMLLNEIKARLQNCTIANGYAFDVDADSISEEMPTQPKIRQDGKIRVYMSLDADDLDNTGNRNYKVEYRNMSVFVGGIMKCPRTEVASRFTSKIGGNLWAALNRETTAPLYTDKVSQDLGGLGTIKLEEVEPVYSKNSSPVTGSVLRITVRYLMISGSAFELKE